MLATSPEPSRPYPSKHLGSSSYRQNTCSYDCHSLRTRLENSENNNHQHNSSQRYTNYSISRRINQTTLNQSHSSINSGVSQQRFSEISGRRDIHSIFDLRNTNNESNENSDTHSIRSRNFEEFSGNNRGILFCYLNFTATNSSISLSNQMYLQLLLI